MAKYTKVITEIDYGGNHWICRGEQTEYDGNLYYMFLRDGGTDGDVVLCKDPYADNPELSYRKQVPGVGSYAYGEYPSGWTVEPTAQIEYKRMVNTIEDGGQVYKCKGYRTMADGNLMYMYMKDGGIENDVILCTDPSENNPQIFHRTMLPGGTYQYDIQEPRYLKITAACEEGEESTVRMVVRYEEVTPELSLEYSLDDGATWEEYEMEDDDGSMYGQYINLQYGESVMFRGNPSNLDVDFESQGFIFDDDGTPTAVSGDITSLLNGVGGDVALPSYAFSNLFADQHIVSAPNLPSTSLGDSCYYSMFDNCTALVTAPTLPATTLANYCYSGMFQGCTSLTTAPALPATTLAECCCDSMFQGCTSLTTAPELPATTLAEGCYNSMFDGCTSLETAPYLPAEELVSNCYNKMFYECSSLNHVEAMFLTDPGDTGAGGKIGWRYTSLWLSGVSETGTFVKNENANWNRTGENAVPTGWDVETSLPRTQKSEDDSDPEQSGDTGNQTKPQTPDPFSGGGGGGNGKVINN